MLLTPTVTDGRVVLEYGLDVATLEAMEEIPVGDGPTVQKPKISQINFKTAHATLNPGQTLVQAGLERMPDQEDGSADRSRHLVVITISTTTTESGAV
jgi:hypothetical protein